MAAPIQEFDEIEEFDEEPQVAPPIEIQDQDLENMRGILASRPDLSPLPWAENPLEPKPVPDAPNFIRQPLGEYAVDTLAQGGIGLQEGQKTLGKTGWTGVQAATEPLFELGPLSFSLTGIRPTSMARSMAGGARELAQESMNGSDELAALSSEIGGEKIARTVGQAIPSLAPAVATGPFGLPAVIASSGAQAGLGTLSDAQGVFEQLDEERGGFIPNPAFRTALAPAALDAIQTAAITAVAGKLFGPGVEGATAPVKAQMIRKTIGDRMKEMTGESLEEGAQQFISDFVVKKMSYDPNVSFEDALKGALEAAAVGGIMGAAVPAITDAGRRQPQSTPPTATAAPPIIQDAGAGALQPGFAQFNTEAKGIAGPPSQAMDFARALPAMPVEDFLKTGQSFNKQNIELGLRATPAELAELKQLKAQADARAEKAVADMPNAKTDADIQRITAEMGMPQFYNEAIRLAELVQSENLRYDGKQVGKNKTLLTFTLMDGGKEGGSFSIDELQAADPNRIRTKAAEVRKTFSDAQTEAEADEMDFTALDPHTGAPVSSIQALLEKADARLAQVQNDQSRQRAAQIEGAPTEQPQPINPGGSQSALPQAQQEVSKKNNSIKAFADASGVEYVEGDTAKTILAKMQAKAATPPVQAAGPGMVGMGGATPSEFGSPVPYITSNKNAKVDEERKARGLPPMMDTARQSNQAAWDEAMRIVDENSDVQDRLINDLVSNPRALTPVENAMVMHRRIFLRNEYEKALHRWREMFEFGDMERAAEESQRVKDFSSQLADLETVTKATGAESGRSLQARKMMANEDYTLAAMELAAMEAKGRNLTPEEHLQLIRANERIADLERRLAEVEAGREAKEIERQTTETMQEVSGEAKSEAKSKDFDIDREERLIGGIKAKIDKGQQNEITPLVQQLARVFWRRGIRGRDPMIDALHETLKTILPDFTRDQTQRAFSGYGDFKALSKEEIDVGLRDLRGQTQQVLKLESLEARKPLEKTGQERRVPSDEERRLIKQVNELKRKYGVVVTDPATQLKSALQSRKTYYEHRISDLKHEIETRQRIVKTKSPSPTDPELDALRAEHDRLKAEHDSIFPPREITDEQRLKLAIAAAERNQAQWEARLQDADKGIFSKRTPGRQITSAELELIQAETAAIREHVQELKDLATPKKSKEEIALQSLKTRMATRMAEFRDRIARKDFTKKERKPVVLDAEGNKLKAELDTVKEEFNTKLEQDRWAKMSVFNKTRRKIADVYDAARALMTTGELSFILRQAKLPALSHPIQTAKALPDMFRALLANEQKAHEIDLAVHNHPDAPAARAAKLAIIEEGVSLHKQEEILMGRWVGKIPVVKNFNRAAQVFLNRVRFDMWQAMRKSMSKSGTPTPEEDKQIAMFVNEATGRGGLGKLEPAAVPLARVMFSPRYYASRLQLAAGHSLWGGTMRTRRIIATEYARSLIGLGLYYTLLSYMFSDDDDEKRGGIGKDPRSTDFGKVNVGNTRLDPLAGLSQVIVLAARTASGEKTTGKGKVVPLRGEKVKYGDDQWSDIMARHLRGKLHPVPASVANLFDGTDLGGDEATLINQSQNLIAPITYMDIYAALKEQDLPDGVALALLALLGEGVQTYEKKEKK